MKLKTIFAAVGLAAAAIGATGTAHADHWDHDRRWDNDRRWDHDRRWDNDRRWDRDRHWDRGRYRGWGHRVNCWTEWHHHHRYRVCR